MKRFIILLIFAFLISGGTVGILFQEGVGGVKKDDAATEQISEEAATTEETVATDSTLTDASVTEEETESDVDPDFKTMELPEEGVTSDTSSEDEMAQLEAEAESEAAAEAALEADEAAKAEEEEAKAEEEKAKKEEEKAKKEEEKAKKEKEAKGPFYAVECLGYNGGGLTLHKNPTGEGDSLGTIAIGTKGYMIGSSSSGKQRRLVYIDGKVGYISKTCTEVTEIPADEYPDMLLSITEEDIGSEFSVE